MRRLVAVLLFVVACSSPLQAQPAADSDSAGERSLFGRLVDETGAPVVDADLSLFGPEIFSARSGKDGRYQFDAIKEGGEYRLIIESQRWVGFQHTRKAPRLALKAGTPMERDFTLPRACMIRVQVLDEAGAPVVGVRVLPMPVGIDGSDRPAGLNYDGAESDKAGWAEVGVPALAEPYHLATLSDDYAFARVEVTASDPKVLTMRALFVARGAEVRGTAICSDGKPATGWAITIQPTWWNFLTQPGKSTIGADGSFTLPHVTPGRYHVSLSVPSGGGSRVSRILSDVELPSAGGVLELKLNEASPQATVAIAGRVRLVGGEPKQGVTVMASAEAGGHHGMAMIGRGGNAFRIDDLPPGRYELQFSSPDIEEKTLRGVTAPSDDLDVELQVVGRPMLRGRVTLPDGAAATRFRARLEKIRTLRGSNYVPDGEWREVDDAAGEFSIETVGPGVYRLAVSADGFSTTWSGDINTDLYDGELVELALSTGATLAGQVVDEQGAAIAGARVIPMQGLLANGRQQLDAETLGAVTDAEGRFLLERMSLGEEMLRVMHPAYSFKLLDKVTVAAGANEIDAIVLPRGATVRGRVFDEAGRPLGGVNLSFCRDGYRGDDDVQRLMGEFGNATTDDAGQYEVQHLPAELCRVERENPWSTLGVVRHAIRPRGDGELVLDLGGEKAVRGRLLVNGKPMASMRIQLSDWPSVGMFQAYAMTDAEGRFAFWGPATGQWNLYFAAPGRRNEWALAAPVTIEPDASDLGDVDARTSDVAVAVRGLSVDDAASARVMLSKYHPVWPHGDDAGMAATRTGADELFVFNYVLPGEYEAVCTRPDRVTLRERVTVPAGGARVAIDLEWPEGTAAVTGELRDDMLQGYAPKLWSKDRRIGTMLLAKTGKRFEVAGLPAGDYYLTRYDTRDAAPAMEFSLAEGETKELELSDENYLQPPMSEGLLVVECYTEAGTRLPGCEITLTGKAGTFGPHYTQGGRVTFVAPAGRYVMTTEFPGMERDEREVTLAPISAEGAPTGEYEVEVWLRASRKGGDE